MFITAALTFASMPALALENQGSVRIDPNGYGVQTFKCVGYQLYSDIPLDNIHGCDIDYTEHGSGAQPSKLFTVHYDWEVNEEGKNEPRKQKFYQLPDGEIHRLLDVQFLESPKLLEYFEESISPLPNSFGKKTNITLERFAQRNLDAYGETFCMKYYLKYPFQGTFGWCQGDRLVGGEAGYIKGALTFGEAAIRVQNYVYDRNLKLGSRILSKESMTAINTDKNGWIYYAFAVPGEAKGAYQGALIFRVYFNGYIEAREVAHMPEDPYDL